MRYLHELKKEGREGPPPARDEVRIWIQRAPDEAWLGQQIIEWSKATKCKWLWEMVGDLRGAGFELPYKAQAQKLWEEATGIREEEKWELGEHEGMKRLHRLNAQITAAAERGAYDATHLATFMEEWGWCWDPNLVDMIQLPPAGKEEVWEAMRRSRLKHMKVRLKSLIEGMRPGNEDDEFERWFRGWCRGSWVARAEWLAHARDLKQDPQRWALFEAWLARRVVTWGARKGQKRMWWSTVTKHLGEDLSPQVLRAVMDDMIGWTFEADTADKFAKYVRKHVESEAITTVDIKHYLERASQKWGTAEVNRAMRNTIDANRWGRFWRQRAQKQDAGYYPAIKALQDAKIWSRRRRTRSI
jgi:hypothetical protein